MPSNPYPTRLTLLFTLLTLLLLSNRVFADDATSQSTLTPTTIPTTVPIAILGHTYQAVLQENQALLEKINNAPHAENAQRSQHYSGTLKDIDDSWVRLSLIDQQWQGVVSLYGSLHIVGHTEPSTAKSNTELVTFGLSSSPASEHEHTLGRCQGNHKTSHAIATAAASANPTAKSTVSVAQASFPEFCANQIDGVCLIAELEFAFDQQFQTLFADQSAAQAASLVNIVEGYYINDLNIAFNTITLELLTSDVFSTTTDASLLLDDIETKKANGQIPFLKNNHALFHLVSGRDFDDDTAGVAFLGSVCFSGGAGSGTSSVVGFGTNRIPFTALVVAHELGHNFGAGHDGEGTAAACPIDTFLMSPSLSSSFDHFSSCSIDDIKSKIATATTSTNPALCFDFPADVAITADPNNPLTAARTEIFSSMYSLVLQNSFQPVTQLRVQGSVDTANGQYVSATANGSACNVTAGGASYRCDINNPGNSVALVVNTRPVGTATELTLTHTSSIQTDSVVDRDSSNDGLSVNFSITEPITPTTSTNTSSSDSGGGGGGGTIGWPLLISLWLLACLGLPTRRSERRC